MAINIVNEFKPDYNIHPGLILKEIIASRGMRKMELARRVGLEEKTMSQILNGKAPIETETAIALERVLGIPDSTWNNLSANYKLRKKQRERSERLAGFSEWADSFSVRELVKRRLIEKPSCDSDKVDKLLRFFGVGQPADFDAQFSRLQVLYRRSPAFKNDPIAAATWLRIAEVFAQDIDAAPYDHSAFMESVKTIRAMTTKNPSEFAPAMVRACASSGVALVFVKEISGVHLSGASHWLNPHKAIIALSLRHKYEDHFWFSFFHEAAHILFHSKKQAFINCDNAVLSKEETEADTFAADILVPAAAYSSFANAGSVSKSDILQFAKSIGVAPGVVVGRLQKDKLIKYSWHNELRRSFELNDESLPVLKRQNS